MKSPKKMTTLISRIVATLVLGSTYPVLASNLDISNVPLFLSDSVEPNILFVIDDSGSMNWEVTLNKGTSSPGSADELNQDCTSTNNCLEQYTAAQIAGESSNQRIRRGVLNRCPGYNVMAYNPRLTYLPWTGVDEDGNAFPNITNTVGSVTPSYNGGPMDDPFNGHTGNADKSNMADISDHIYFLWDDKNNDGEYADGECPTALIENPLDFDTVFTGSDCEAMASCETIANLYSKADKTAFTNYANWYTYYRKREYVAINAVTRVVQDSTAYIGLGTFNKNKAANGQFPGAIVADMNSPTNKTNILSRAAGIHSGSGTPIRKSLNEAGKYFRDGNSQIFGSQSFASSVQSPIQVARGGECQHNFTILMSDGFANGSDQGLGNVDAGTVTGFAGGKYADTLSDTIADVAMTYFESDLATGIENKVPLSDGTDYGQTPPSLMHQHMVTYTVAFGVNGTLPCNITLDTNCSVTWPTSISYKTAGDPKSIDDLMHAAYNGRGQYLSAGNPIELANSIRSAVESAGGQASTAAAVSSNSTTLNTGTVIYQARFDSADWSGNLISISVSTGPTDTRPGCNGIAAGKLCTGQNWGANEQTLNHTTRSVISYAPGGANGVAGTGIPFRWPSDPDTLSANDLSAAQVQTLSASADVLLSDDEKAYGEALLNFLRGDDSNEGDNGLQFRKRENRVLGDIINSAPVFVGAPGLSIPDGLETTTYSSFRTDTTIKDRPRVVYVGANDGMLHAYDAGSGATAGDEVLSYVPSSVFANLESLADTSYSHKFYVDGSPTVGDAFFQKGGSGTSAWRTVLLGSLRAGGQGVFALDITNPNNFSEANADDLVLWEFTDNDLGFTYSQPDIVRLSNGKWAAIFGNGYNSTAADGTAGSGEAFMYIVYLDTGAHIKIGTGVGDSANPNGLSTVTPVDIDNDYIVDYVYGGDLQGNMWRFNLSDANTNNWDAAKIFTTDAPGADGPQAITTRPSVAFHPESGEEGFIVYFGTGRYIDTTDDSATGQATQTFYGVWDEVSKASETVKTPTFNRNNSEFLEQEITQQITGAGNARITTNNAIDWTTQHGWYIDLTVGGGNNLGERQITNSIVRGDRVVFTTIIPDDKICGFGGTSWIMELDSSDGSQLDDAPFDTNNDGVIDAQDLITTGGTSTVSSGYFFDGIITEPTIIGSSDSDIEFKIVNSSTGAAESIGEKPPGSLQSTRTSWIELEF